jgi:alpha,alpha-trehalase
MAGTVDLIQRCYTGIEARGDTLRFNPCLPEELNRLQLCIRYRGHTLELDLSPEQLKICCAFCDKEPIQLCFNEERRYLSGGQTTEFKLGSWKTIKF